MFKGYKWLILPLLFITTDGLKSQTAETDFYRTHLQLPATPVKNQYQSSTCWSFATLSFIESELLRTGRGEFDLSEIYIIRQTYIKKAEKYIRLHGKLNFSGGGEANDVTETIKSMGILPESVYPGRNFRIEEFDFHEFDSVLLAFVSDIVNNEGIIDINWQDDFNSLLDKYLGKVPEKFTWKGKGYTPQSFAAFLGLDMDDYYMFGSYTHHPYNEKFVLEVPDNWTWGYIYNISTDELIGLIDSSLKKGYSVVWAADNSESGFSFRRGHAIINDPADISGMEKDPVLLRQQQFDNYDTQDDHGMHITGVAYDNDGGKYYIVKNSWGTGNLYNGYLYASEPYLRLKTISVMVHRDVLSEDMRDKLMID